MVHDYQIYWWEFPYNTGGASYIPEMSKISSACYLRLLHSIFTDRAIRFTDRGSPFDPPSEMSALTLPRDTLKSPKDDLDAFASLGDTDAVLRSYDGAEFEVHRLVLRLARGNRLFDHPDSASTTHGKGKLPVYDVDANGEVLAELLRLCYPTATVHTQDFIFLRNIAEVASKYNITRVLQMMKEQLRKVVETYPLELYFLAAHCGWDDVAQATASAASKLLLEEQYVPEMENTSAKVYYCLFEYQYQYSTAIAEVLSRYAPDTSQWRSAGTKSKPGLSNSIPPMISFALAEAELVKANNAAKSSGYRNHYADPVYVMKPDDLLDRSKSLERDIVEAQTKLTLKITTKASLASTLLRKPALKPV